MGHSLTLVVLNVARRISNSVRRIALPALWLIPLAALHAETASYDPGWAAIKPARSIHHQAARDADIEQNGAALRKVIEALQPGDRLEVGEGSYSVSRFWDVQISGTEQAPIWIVASAGARVVITRPDDRQNVLNIGQAKQVSFLCLRGLEVTGGSHGIRLGHCSHVWIDRCHIHDTGDVCLSANSANSDRLYITRNHIHHGGGTAEGMYLGGNHATVIMSQSVIALNHVHDCRGTQGDGIEIKQGSWGNRIVENIVHDCNYPCIIAYGTAGRPQNIIERNLCYSSGDNVMQVQGEAVVRNNVLINGRGAGFASTDHQGQTLNLQVIHNTIVNAGHAFRGGSWNAREKMVIANNVLYSRDASAMHFPNDRTGVSIRGNVVLGQAPNTGCRNGRGLVDFQGLTWDASRHDATPTPAAPFDDADAAFRVEDDFAGKPRSGGHISGAFGR